MKHIARLILLIAVMVSSIQLWAQDKNDDQNWEARKQQFKADKIAFITTRLNFTVEEAQVFWPIYNKYDVIFDKIGCDRRANYDPRRCKPFDELGDDACRKMMDATFELDQRELDARRQMYDELLKNFAPSKVARYYNAEFEFRRQVMSDNRPKGGSFGKSYKND